MGKYYANVFASDDTIFYTYYEDGVRRAAKKKYRPSVAVPDPDGDIRSFAGGRCRTVQFDSIRKMRNFVKQYADSDGVEIHGNVDPVYQFIAEEFPGKIDPSPLRAFYVDIEVQCDIGFPDPGDAEWPVSAVTIYDSESDKFAVLGTGEFETSDPRVAYVKCSSETELLRKMLSLFATNPPDILTGWNVKYFDIPYLVNRISRILGDGFANRLSPYGKVIEGKVRSDYGSERQVFNIVGVSTLDYLDLYKKFAWGGRESYTLEYIAQYELGEGKVDYRGEFDRLSDLYNTNHHLFIEYNIRDVELIVLLEKKLGYIQLATSIAFMAKCRLEDIFSPVRTWETYIYNYLRDRGIATPPKKSGQKSAGYEGAYVKEPIVGLDDWVVSFDVASMYPTCLVSNNISPDCKVDPSELPPEAAELAAGISVQKLLAGAVDLEPLRKLDLNVTANGTLFRRDRQGVIAEIVQHVYEKRVEVRRELKKLKTSGASDEETEMLKKRMHQEQLALKVLINSLYGAYANQYFLYHDVDLASAITSTGQLYIRSIEKAINEFMSEHFGEDDYVKCVDTDSVYVRMAKVVEKRFPNGASRAEIAQFLDSFSDRIIQPVINSTFERIARELNSRINYMSMKREKICEKALAVAKKKYAFLVVDSEGDIKYDDPELSFTGIEVVRSSTPAVVREQLKRCVRIIFEGSNDDLIDYIEKCRAEFEQLPFEKVAFPRSVSTFDKYAEHSKSIPIAVRGAKAYNRVVRELGLEDKCQMIGAGDKVKFAYLKEPNRVGSNVIAVPEKMPDELRELCPVNYAVQFEKAFLSPLQGILDAIGWSSRRVSTLESFFS